MKKELLVTLTQIDTDEIIEAVDFVNVINYELREGVRTNNTNLKSKKLFNF